jgi:hypothetical protein
MVICSDVTVLGRIAFLKGSVGFQLGSSGWQAAEAFRFLIVLRQSSQMMQ